MAKQALMFSGGPDSLSAYFILKNREQFFFGHPFDLIYFPNVSSAFPESCIPERIAGVLGTIGAEAVVGPNMGLSVIEKQDYEVPGRHIFFASAAAALGYDEILFAIEGGLTYLADRSPEFWDKISHLLTFTFGRSISVSSAIRSYTKAEAILEAMEGAPNLLKARAYTQTISCYAPVKKNKDVYHCGECDACIRRFVAFSLVNFYFTSTNQSVCPILGEDYWNPPMGTIQLKKYIDSSGITDKAHLREISTFSREIYKVKQVCVPGFDVPLKERITKEDLISAITSVSSYLDFGLDRRPDRTRFFSNDSFTHPPKHMLITHPFTYCSEPVGIRRLLNRDEKKNIIATITAGNVESLVRFLDSFVLDGDLQSTLLVVYINSVDHLIYKELFSILSTGVYNGKRIPGIHLNSTLDILIIFQGFSDSLQGCRKKIVNTVCNLVCPTGAPQKRSNPFIAFVDDDVFAKGISGLVDLCRFHYNDLRFKYRVPKFPIIFGHEVIGFRREIAVDGDFVMDFDSSQNIESISPQYVDNETVGVKSFSWKTVSPFKIGRKIWSVTGYFMCMPLEVALNIPYNSDIEFWYEDTYMTSCVRSMPTNGVKTPFIGLITGELSEHVQHVGHATQKGTDLYTANRIALDRAYFHRAIKKMVGMDIK